MAIAEQEYLEDPEDQRQAERALEQQRLSAQRQERVSQAQPRRQAVPSQARAAAEAAEGAAELATRQARLRAWQLWQEGAEDAAIAFEDFMLFTGPWATGLYAFRLVFGTLLHVPGVPGYSWAEGIYRTPKILWIILVTTAIYSALFLVAYFIFHPTEIIVFGVNTASGFFFDVIKYFSLGT